MKLVYLASPYRSKDEWGLHQNIHHAHKAARQIWQISSLVCISPCSNTAFFGGDDIPDSVWLEGDIEILRRCDALFLNEGWENSSGCIDEKTFAEKIGLPVFTTLDDLQEWAICARDI